MLAGRFGGSSDSPYIEGYINFPRLRVKGNVSFLVDTGADRTIIMPDDAHVLGVDQSQLKNKRKAKGIGGSRGVFHEQGIFVFVEPSKRLYIYVNTIGLLEPADPPDPHEKLPSLLGRDILDRWRIVCDRSKNRLTFTVRSADQTIPLAKKP